MGNGNYQIHVNSFTRFLFSLITLFIMLGALPVGVYLVGQRTAFLPEAGVKQLELQGETSFTIEQNPQLSSPGKLAVNILARSDENAVNLFATRLSFPSNLLELDSIATSSAKLPENIQPDVKTQFIANKWLQTSLDGEMITLVGGVAGPGIKTDPNTKYILATVFFKIKSPQSVTLHFDPASTIFRNSDNTTLITRVNDLTFVVAQNGPTPSPTPKTRQLVKLISGQPTLNLISPIGGELISFNQPLTIKWSAINVDKMAVSLLMNDQILGMVASPSAKLQEVTIKPSDFILPTYLGPINTFKVAISGVSSKGVVVSDESDGPFAISSNDGFSLDASGAASLAKRGGDANSDGVIDFFDVSKLLSSYGEVKDGNFGVDLNGDQAVNDVDFYLLRNLMLQKGLIQ